MKKTTRMCGLASIDCFAHKLQLAVYGGLRSVIDDEDQFTTFIENTKKFVRKLRKSPVDRDHFKDLQSLEELSPRWLVKGIEVRWSSLHDMLERFVENRSVVKAFLIDRSDYPKFNSGDFSMMMKILHALKPIKEATTMLQGRSVTISAVIPTIVVLRRAVLNDAASELCSAILQNLETRYHLIAAAAIVTLDADPASWKTADKYANTSELLIQLLGSFLQLKNFVTNWL
ncbi:hypothetical protein QR680_009146 [Steinernema hermaphroditum]|uniref:Uncharacterized protein n=1 Tax=Steinernema hermaphroditum TaxID=289476 RepID=A0AA39M957_9BILA|nr:hypothetical protein QR680_009146 [Steinernema hermaphroditum]